MNILSIDELKVHNTKYSYCLYYFATGFGKGSEQKLPNIRLDEQTSEYKPNYLCRH